MGEYQRIGYFKKNIIARFIILFDIFPLNQVNQFENVDLVNLFSCNLIDIIHLSLKRYFFFGFCNIILYTDG